MFIDEILGPPITFLSSIQVKRLIALYISFSNLFEKVLNSDKDKLSIDFPSSIQ